MKLAGIPSLGSKASDKRTHLAFVSVTEKIQQAQKDGQDKPAALGTRRRSDEPLAESDDDIRFDYELRDPFQWWALGAILILCLVVVCLIALACADVSALARLLGMDP